LSLGIAAVPLNRTNRIGKIVAGLIIYGVFLPICLGVAGDYAGWRHWALLILFNLPIIYVYYKILFYDSHAFGDSIVYCLTPGLLSWITDEYKKDFWAELRMSFWWIASALTVYGVHLLVIMENI
jgi:hypothetical protein